MGIWEHLGVSRTKAENVITHLKVVYVTKVYIYIPLVSLFMLLNHG